MSNGKAEEAESRQNGEKPGGPPRPAGPPGNPNAPDGGWGWMVVLGTSIATMMQGIMVQGFGVLFLEFVRRYDGSAAATSWIGAINMASVGLFSKLLQHHHSVHNLATFLWYIFTNG